MAYVLSLVSVKVYTRHYFDTTPVKRNTKGEKLTQFDTTEIINLMKRKILLCRGNQNFRLRKTQAVTGL